MLRMQSLVVIIMGAVCSGLVMDLHHHKAPHPQITCPLEIQSVLKKNAVNNTVVFTALDIADDYVPMIKNYACGVHRAGLPLLIWSLTPRTHSKMMELGYPDVQVAHSEQTRKVIPGNAEYMGIVQQKIVVMKIVLDCGFDLLYLDSDLGINMNPLPYFSAHQGDVQISTNYPQAKVNTGVVYIRSFPHTRALVDAWVDEFEAETCNGWDCGDQELLSKVLHDKCGFLVEKGDFWVEDSYHTTLSCSFLDQNLKFDLLPPGKFADGPTKKFGDEVFTYHPNFSGKNGAVEKKEAMLRNHTFNGQSMWCSE